MALTAHSPFNSSLAQDGIFFLGVPLLLCACMTIAGPYAAQIGLARAFAFVAWRSCGPTWPLWLTAAVGALAAGPLVFVWASGVYAVAGAVWPSLQPHGGFAMDSARWQAIAMSEAAPSCSGSPSS